MSTRSVSFASRASSSSRRTSDTNTGTVKYGTLLSSGATASYPTSFISSPQYNPASTETGGNKLSAGTIAGIVVACVAFVFLVAFLAVLFIVRRRKASKRKRESRTGLLPSSSNSAAQQPEMAQYPNYASTTVGGSGTGSTASAATMPAVPSAAAASSHTSRTNKLHSIPGLSFGSGHRRTDSNNSTTPFLAGVPDSPSRPSTGNGSFEANRSPTSNRYSMESTTTYTGSPTMPYQNRFSTSQFGSSP